MSKDIFVGLSGASATWTHMEAISNNLANLSTTGFKAGRVAFKVSGPTDTPMGQAYAMSTEDKMDLTRVSSPCRIPRGAHFSHGMGGFT